MSTMKTYNKRDIQRILKNNGWILHHCKGSHKIYKNKDGQHLTIGSCKYNQMITQRLIKQYNLYVE